MLVALPLTKNSYALAKKVGWFICLSKKHILKD